MKTLFIAVKALLVAGAFIFLWAWVALSLRRFDGDSRLLFPSWSDIPGIVLMVAGGVLALACVGVFIVLGRGTPAPFDPPQEFVARGPYRYVRNPMYIGALTVLAGLALYQHSVSVLLLCLGLFLLVNLFLIVYEEPDLEARFGQRYEDYRKMVPRWIPRIER